MDSQPESLIQALRLAAIVECSDDAIVSKNVDGIIMSWNAAAERMFGYKADEVIGKSIRIIIPPDRQSEEDVVLGRIRLGERVEHFETVRCRRNGERFDVSITVSPIRTPDGRIVGASKIARDVSERKRTERALAEARAGQADLRRRLTTIIDASSALLLSPRVDDVLQAILVVAREVLPADAVAVWRADGSAWRIVASQGLSAPFASANVEAAAERWRLSDELLVAESLDDERLATRRDVYTAEGIASLLVIPLQAPSDFAASIAFYYRTLHVFSDVERESAAGLGRLANAVIVTAQLYDSQRLRRFESEFVSDAGAILVSSPDYREALSRLAARAVPRMADWCIFHLQTEDNAIEPAAVAVAEGIDASLIEPFVRGRGGEPDTAFSVDRVVRTGTSVLVPRWTEQDAHDYLDERLAFARAIELQSIIAVPLVAHSRALGALTVGTKQGGAVFGSSELRFTQDLAHRVALTIDNIVSYEDARRANRLKDEFLANLSHELRTPLNAIVGYAQMLKRGAITEDKRVRAYEILDKNASALTQIVEDVLDISRIVSGKIRLQLQPTRLAPVLVHSVETVQPGADAKGVRIDLEVQDEAATVAGDADRLQQVFWNLLSNAVKFTPREGRVVVRLGTMNGGCEISVADNGAGVDPKFLPHIFERFRQGDSRYGREHGGLGLGLAIARQIVEMHGGSIAAESAGAGAGATFRVVLPAIAEVHD